MIAFRIWMGLQFVAIVAYTLAVGLNHGWNLMPVFFGDMLSMNWRGQFNFDFSGFLLLSGVWVAWRNAFSTVGVALGAVATFGGILFLSAYLFWCSLTSNGDFAALMLGEQRSKSAGG